MYSAGFSLMEVMVSLLLLSMTLLGLDAMQVYASIHARNTYYFNQATNQLKNIMERLYLLQRGIDYNAQIAIWNQENQRALPNGHGEVSGEYPNLTLIISWGKTQQNCLHNQTGASGCLKENIQLA